MARILVIDDDPDICSVIATLLGSQGHEVEVAHDPARAFELADAERFALVITDLDLKTKVSGLDLLKEFKSHDPSTEVLLISGYGTLETAIEAVRAGAFDYVSKPFDVRELGAMVDRALARKRLPAELAPPARALPSGLVGRTASMLQVYKEIANAADAVAPVLVIGESGTGKELVARAIHEHGARSARPFVAVNCGALAETLLESELFGHVRGSFTGAVADKKGLFEQASGGTVFLDEIGETSPGLQVKLLRVLQEGEVRPVGGVRDLKVNARVVAATNRDLEQEVAERRFRQDLFYRLSVMVIRLPPLRERRDDIPLLVSRFLRNAGARAGRTLQLTPAAMKTLVDHDWPGNVRELENVVERLVFSCRRPQADVEDLPEQVRSRPVRQVEPGADALFADLPTLDELERRYLLKALDVAKGNRTRAAEILGVNRRTLYRMASRFGIPLD
jgi:DNA-binding NtrC family response regulator